MSETNLPLNGVVVLDLSRVLAGPLSTMVLADLGAQVIKVEHPKRGDDTRDWGVQIAPGDTSYYYSFNRNKQSIAVDLSTEAGRAEVRQLCAQADVVVENFKPGTMERFGLGYDRLRAANPGMIYCAISGYDRYGAEAQRPGYDLVIQGECGLMAINGEEGQAPLKFGVAAVDLFTGMYAAQAILGALFARERDAKNGKGRRIDLALYDAGLMISSYYGLEALLKAAEPVKFGNEHPSIVPYGVFEAKDGPLVIACGNNRQFADLCQVIGRPEFAQDPLYATNQARSTNRDDLSPKLRAAFGAMARADLLSGLAAVGIPCGEVLGLYEALTHPRSHAGGLWNEQLHPSGRAVPLYAPPWRFDGTRPPSHRPPQLDENGAEIRAKFLSKIGE